LCGSEQPPGRQRHGLPGEQFRTRSIPERTRAPELKTPLPSGPLRADRPRVTARIPAASA
jgi:hypothetical protein